DVDNLRRASDLLADAPCKVLDGDLLGVPDVEDLADGALFRRQLDERTDDIRDVGETARLRAVAEDGHRHAFERLSRERRDHHAVAARLTGPDGVEEADDDDREI